MKYRLPETNLRILVLFNEVGYIVLLHPRKKSKLMESQWTVYQAFATGATRQGKAMTRLLRTTMIKQCS